MGAAEGRARVCARVGQAGWCRVGLKSCPVGNTDASHTYPYRQKAGGSLAVKYFRIKDLGINLVLLETNEVRRNLVGSTVGSVRSVGLKTEPELLQNCEEKHYHTVRNPPGQTKQTKN